MTAAELASFRTLLQAQAVPPPRPHGGLFARMRARLTVVEKSDPPLMIGGEVAARPAVSRPQAVVFEAVVFEAAVQGPVADPLPSTPAVFGRRSGEREPAPAAPAVALPAAALPPPTAEVGPEASTVRLRRRPLTPEMLSTPDEDLRPARAAVAVAAPAPGVIAGWSHARPPSAQRRILQRLEAVFNAELEGLNARIAADASAV